MIEVTPNIGIREDEIQLQFVRAPGPGGQHVNKTATAVQLRYDIKHSASLSEDIRRRLLQLADRRITTDGVLIITARRFRSQERNRQDALQRLTALVQKALQEPSKRRRSAPTAASVKRRLEDKHRQAVKKSRRRPIAVSED